MDEISAAGVQDEMSSKVFVFRSISLRYWATTASQSINTSITQLTISLSVKAPTAP
jgi:hypothetical protein